MDIKSYEDLVKKLNYWGYEYYTLGTPSVSDSEYDVFYDKLIEFEKQNPSLISKDSPSQKVGFEILESSTKKKHSSPMHSLKKAQKLEEVEKFIEDVKKVDPTCTFTVELKFDGLSIVLCYENGYFVEARTRGNGVVGEIVTEQVKTIRSIPLSVPTKEYFEVQGEVYMPLAHFDSLNKKIKKDYMQKHNLHEPLDDETLETIKDLQFKTARNAAAGSLRNLNTRVTAERKLDAFLYGISSVPENTPINSQNQLVQFLKDNKLKTNQEFHVVSSFKEIEELIHKITDIRPNLPYDIDGIVIKANEFDVRNKLGFTAKHPRWAIAYKFESETAVTKLIDIKHFTNRTGVISFVADLKPVELGGATFEKATLNNISWMKEKNLMNCIGADVILVRSNDVIPKILSLYEGEGSAYIPPTTCSSCGSKLVEKGAHLYCMNSKECEAQSLHSIVHFVSRNGMNIDSLSIKTIEQLFDLGLIKESIDLYSLKKEDLVGLDNFGDKKPDKLVNAIQESLSRPLPSFLFSLGIPLIGLETATKLCEHFSTLDNLRNASLEDLSNVSSVGENVSVNIFNFFINNKDLIDRFISLGVQTTYKKTVASVVSPHIENKKFVLTGKMPSGDKKSVIEKIIKENNGSIVSSVSKNTDYVIYGEDAGSKYKKALELESELNRKILLSEEEFYSLLKS